MRSLSTSEILIIWEEGLSQWPFQKALSILIAALPDKKPEYLAKLSIGERDSYLLDLREAMFGSQLDCLTACPECGERLEFTLKVSDIKANYYKGYSDDLSLEEGDYKIHFRLPNSIDLAAFSGYQDIESAKELLLKRCLLKAYRKNEEIPIGELPRDLVDLTELRMPQIDSQSDVRLDLSCPSCGRKWKTIFDIVSFLWSDMEAWAQRILYEVHILASAYGWREADILSMSARRRQFYLGMLSE
jgi:hypothetical protein